MLFCTHLLLLLQPSVLWLFVVTFNNDARPPPKWILREFDVSRFRPRLGGYPTSNRLRGKIWPRLRWLPGSANRATRPGVIKLKWEIIWTGGLPQLSWLPHLTGVPHLKVNRPLDNKQTNKPTQVNKQHNQPNKKQWLYELYWLMWRQTHLGKISLTLMYSGHVL